jgi:hypothetical protein
VAARKPEPTPTLLQRVTARLERPQAIIAAVTAFWVLASLLGGSVYSWSQQAWRHYTGAELAHELRPEVSALKGLATETSALAAQVAERTNASEARLKKAESTLDEIRKLKEIEQERTRAVEAAQRTACLAGELAHDTCHRLGYPTGEAR